MRERKMIFLPSGVQAITMLFGPMRSETSSRPSVGVKVIRLGTPPAAGMRYTSVLPSYWPVKAMDLPSGENRANISKPSWLVSLRATPPSASTLYRSPA